MKIIFYRYGSIYEPDMLTSFKKAGLEVIEISDEINNKTISSVDRMKLVEDSIKKHSPLFVYGINYFPIIAEICHIYKVLYISQTVDSPILTLFSDSISYDTNRIFLFDREQYNYFRSFNKEHIYHLPLASATERFDKVISSITDYDRRRFTSDISFVGSTYREKDPLAEVRGLSQYTEGYINALVESCLLIYGYYPVKDALSQNIVDDIKKCSGNHFPTASTDRLIASPDTYIVSHEYIGSHIAVIERERILNTLAAHFSVDLYTRSDTSYLKGVNINDGIRTLDEMPKVFHLSKINLNITMRPIEAGLPLRCFDILGCGGFMITNYQEELNDMFVIGRDLETFSSLDELIDKCAYYLSHDEVRIKISRSGYERVKSQYTHYHRLQQMLSVIV